MIPDEAFGILLLEHNINKWEEMVRTITKDDDEKKVATTWASTSAKGKKMSGWVDKATSRFHEIVKEVQSNREIDGMNEREEDMLKKFAITAGETKNKRKRKSQNLGAAADEDVDNTPSAPNYLLTLGQTADI